MNTKKDIWTVCGIFFIVLFSWQNALSQTFSIHNPASSVEVEGTSNIHDWKITGNEFEGSLKAELLDGQLVKIEQLVFAVEAESLKSGKGGMDKNTYKALKTDANKQIIYQLQKVNNIDCVSNSSCKIVTTGFLTIAGTKKQVDVVFDAKVSGDKIVITGEKKLKMTDYKVDPPTAMFGTITTGDDVNVKFKVTYLQN